MGISLLVVAMLLSIWAMTSVLHAQSGLSALDVSGGDTYPGCKDPCDDTWITSLIECFHLSGDTCKTDRCIINNIRYLKCTEGTAGCGETDCEYHKDYNDWYKSIYVRWMSCVSNTPGTLDLGACATAGPGYQRFHTPCVYDSCYGEQQYYWTYTPRTRCD